MGRPAVDSRLAEYPEARHGRWQPLPRLRKRSSNGALAGVFELFERGQRPAPAAAAVAIKQWLKDFAACVRAKEFDRGRAYFHLNAYCFGSLAHACTGLDTLVEQQWRKIWPNITGFGFQLRQLRYQVSGDGRMACAMVPWRSVGYHADGTAFHRGGRLTVLLTRASTSTPWRAYHTHYSLNPGTSQTTPQGLDRTRS